MLPASAEVVCVLAWLNPNSRFPEGDSESLELVSPWRHTSGCCVPTSVREEVPGQSM